MKSYLSDRKQCVFIDGIKSPYLKCPAGVPQGSILGPILVSLYINDLPNVCKSINIQMYADDAVIYTYAKNVQEASQILTLAMIHVEEWLTKSCLLLNTKKNCAYDILKTTKRGDILWCISERGGAWHCKLVQIPWGNIESHSHFKSHVKKLLNTVKFNLLKSGKVIPDRKCCQDVFKVNEYMVTHMVNNT